MPTTISRDGTAIAFETSGAGPALIVVNGALSDRTTTSSLRPLLDPHFTVFGYDRRGRGDSGDTPPYAPEREIEDLAAVIQASGGAAFVHGHSSGAILSLRAAASGLPIRRLSVNEPPFILPGARPLPPADLSARLEGAIASGDRASAVRLFLLESVQLPERTVQALEASPFWTAMLPMAHTTLYDAAIAGRTEFVPASFASLSTPTLVLHGTASFPWIIATAQALASALPNAGIAALEGQTHSPAPGVIAPHLIRFFSGHAA